jgi:hypothetical protein
MVEIHDTAVYVWATFPIRVGDGPIDPGGTSMRNRSICAALAALLAATGLVTISSGSPTSAATWSITGLDTPGIDATRLAQEIAGQGVTITSANFTGDNRQGGLFAGAGVGDAIGVTDGVVLSTGLVTDVVGPNDQSGSGEDLAGPGDAQLDAIVAPDTTNDAAVLDITFVPTSPDLEINYVFASEEYQEFVDTSFNDVFAFWVNGVNCATVANPSGREPVTINTINHLRNTQIYVDNPTGDDKFDTQFDGFTVPLTCFATVTPGVPNTLKLAIADTSDWIYDAAVFLESSGVTSTPKTKYSPVSPDRLLDTRNTVKVDAGGTVNLPIVGRAGVPVNAVSVALNVTATGAEGTGFLTVFPNGEPFPVASNVNYSSADAVPNLVVAKLGTDGSINIYSDKSAHVIVDIFGWFGTTADSGFVAAPVPTRVFDSRSGAKVGASQVVTFPVVGVGGVPVGTRSIALNLTVTQPDAKGFASVFASGASVPGTSNVNFVAGQNRPNLVFAPVGADGQVSVLVSANTHVIADVLGWYSTASDAQLFKPVKPKRVWDSRQHVIIPAGGELTLKVTDIVGVPSTASAVVLNVTSAGSTGSGFLTVYPANVPQPGTSNVNYAAGQAAPNVLITGVSVDGRIKIFSSAESHIIVDVAGWFG